MSALMMTAGEQRVWIAAYAASWAQLREFKRKYGRPEDDSDLAKQAVDEAWGAVTELRALAKPGACYDFGDDIRDILG